MSKILRSSLLGLKALAEAAVQKVDEAEKHDLENRVTGNVDADKVKTLLEIQNQTIATMQAAIDQLQQRLSNAEANIGRLEAAQPARSRTPLQPVRGAEGGGGWIDNPPPNRR
jgi:hypothetical protein